MKWTLNDKIRNNYWGYLIILISLYQLISIPLRILCTYHHYHINIWPWILFDYLCDVLMIIDFTILPKDGELLRICNIMIHRIWFILSILPMDIINIIWLQTYSNSIIWYRLNRLLQIIIIMKCTHYFQKSIQINLSSMIWTFLQHAINSLLALHLVACIWLTFALHVQHDSNTWLDTIDNNSNVLQFQYLQSFYFACSSLVTLGMGDIVANNNTEMILCIIIMILGICLCARSIALLTFIFNEYFSNIAEHLQQMESLEYYMKARQVPMNVQNNVREFYSYYLQYKTVSDESLDKLPKQLKNSVLIFSVGQIFSELKLFQTLDANTLTNIIGHLKTYVVPPNARICSKGQHINYLYIIINGECVQNNKRYKNGAYFGHECIYNSQAIMPFSIDTTKTTEICTLKQKDLIDCIPEQYWNVPTASHILQKYDTQIQTSLSNISNNIDDNQTLLNKTQQNTWLNISILFTLYIFIMIPFMISFHHIMDYETLIIMWCLDIVIDMFFWMEIILRCKYWYYKFDHFFLLNQKSKSKPLRCCSNKTLSATFEYYLSFSHSSLQQGGGLFIWDVLSLLPIDHIIFFIYGIKMYSLCRLLRLVRLCHLSEYWYHIQTKFKSINPLRLRLLLMVFMFICLGHILGCIWHFVGIKETNSWLLYDNISHSNLLRQYIRSIYFAFIVSTTTGYGDILPQNIWEIFCSTCIICVTSLLYYSAIGAVSAILNYMTSLKLMFEENLDQLFEFLTIRNTPLILAERIKHYYYYLWTTQHGVDEEKVLQTLPIYLRNHIIESLNLNNIKTIPLFKNIPEGLLRSICCEMKFENFVPGDYIISAGDRNPPLIIINSGRACILSADMDYVLGFLDGNMRDYYGDGSFLVEERNLFHVRAITYCHISIITASSIEKACSMYPNEYKDIIYEDSEILNEYMTQKYLNVTNNLKRQKVREVIFANESTDYSTPTQIEANIYLPTHTKVGIWNTLKLLLIMWHGWSISLRLCFKGIHSITFTYVDIILDMVLWMDMYFRAYHFAVDISDKVPDAIVTRKGVYQNYMKYHFKKDMITILPFDLLIIFYWLIIPTQSFEAISDNQLYLLALCRLPKLLNLFEIPYLFLRLRRLVRETGINIPVNIVNLIQLFLLVLAISHTFGCLFYIINILENDTNNWIQRYEWNNISHSSIYLRCIYWCLGTLTVICFGDIVPVTLLETIFTIILTIMGFFIMGAIISNIFTLALNMDQNKIMYTQKCNRFEKFAKRNELPSTMMKRVKSYWNFYFNKSLVPEENRILSRLPRSLRLQIMNETYEEFIYKLYYFKDLTKNIRRNLAERLEMNIAAKDEIIYHRGEIADCLYILTKGEIELYDEIIDPKCTTFSLFESKKKPHPIYYDDIMLEMTSMEDMTTNTTINTNTNDTHHIQAARWLISYDHRSQGDVFGDLSFFMGQRRMSSVRCITDCEFLILPLKSFQEIFNGLNNEVNALTKLVEPLYSRFMKKQKDLFKKHNIPDLRSVNCVKTLPLLVSRYNSYENIYKLFKNQQVSNYLSQQPSTPRTSSRRLSALAEYTSKDNNADVSNEMTNKKTRRLSICTSNTTVKYIKSTIEDINLETKIRLSNENVTRLQSKLQWIYLITLCLLYYIISIPLRLSLAPSKHALNISWLICDLIIVFILWVDYILLLYHHYYSQSVQIPLKLLLYVKIFIAIILLPYDIIIVLLKTSDDNQIYIILSMLPHLVYVIIWKKYHLPTLYKHVYNYTLVIIMFLCCIHIFACIWLYLGEMGMHNSTSSWYDRMTDVPDQFKYRYLTSIYFIITAVTTVGLGDIIPTTDNEYILVLILIGFGSCLLATMTIIFQSQSNEIDAQRKEENILNVQTYLIEKRIPKALQKRVLKHIEYQWNRSKGLDEKLVINDLPHKLQMDIRCKLNEDLIYSIPILSECTNQFLLKRIANVIKPQHFNAFEYIAHSRQLKNEMFFIVSGSVLQTVQTIEDRQLQYELHAGDFFGEDNILKQPVKDQSSSYVAITECQCFTLNKTDYHNIMIDYPHVTKEFNEKLHYSANALKQKRMINSCGEFFHDCIDDSRSQIFSINNNTIDTLNDIAHWSRSPSNSLILTSVSSWYSEAD